MEISDNGLRFLEGLESKEYEEYPDSGGLPTIGIGHLITDAERRSGYIDAKDEFGVIYLVRCDGRLTDEYIYDILRMDVSIAENSVNTNVQVLLNQNQFDALVSFVFNIGVTAFRNSTLLKVLNNKSYDKVPTQMIRWIFAKKKIINGLINRRKKEIKLWNKVS